MFVAEWKESLPGFSEAATLFNRVRPFQVHSNEDTVKVRLDIGRIGRYGVEQVQEKKNSSELVAKHAANPAIFSPLKKTLFWVSYTQQRSKQSLFPLSKTLKLESQEEKPLESNASIGMVCPLLISASRPLMFLRLRKGLCFDLI